MSIYLSNTAAHEGLVSRLKAEGLDVVRDNKSLQEPPVRVGVLNLMPAPVMETTETQWLRWIGKQAGVAVEPIFIKFDNDRRERDGASRKNILSRYIPFSEVAINGLDGLIVTGDNLEIDRHEGFSSRPGQPPKSLPLEEINYYDQLSNLIKWADENVTSTIYSCLASHFALSQFYSVPRVIGEQKTFGVFSHEVVNTGSPFMKNMGDIILAPHSRWGQSPVEALINEADLSILALSIKVGWLAAERRNSKGGKDLFLQGHPEYDALDLHNEFIRDKKTGLALPKNYYKDNKPLTNNVLFSWEADARRLHENWIRFLLKQILQY